MASQQSNRLLGSCELSGQVRGVTEKLSELIQVAAKALLMSQTSVSSPSDIEICTHTPCAMHNAQVKPTCLPQ